MNQVTLIGNIGKEIKFTNEPISRANFSLATSEYRNGEKKTSWHNVVIFGKPAEAIYQYATSGSKLMVQGKIEYNEYEKDGIKRMYVSIIAFNFEFLGGGKKEEENKTSQNFEDEKFPF